MSRVMKGEYIAYRHRCCWLYMGEMTVTTSMVPAPASTERTLTITVFRMTPAIFYAYIFPPASTCVILDVKLSDGSPSPAHSHARPIEANTTARLGMNAVDAMMLRD